MSNEGNSHESQVVRQYRTHIPANIAQSVPVKSHENQ